jgi:DNA-nicking Smr family endonuclease
MKNNKYAHLSEPQAKLDFHGLGTLTPHEIYQMLEGFLEESANNGLERVLVITGKGLHSKNGAIVKPTVQNCLAESPYVQSVTQARRDRGGSGAFEVLLNV